MNRAFFLLCFFVALVCVPSANVAWGETDPRAVVKAMLSRLKQTGEPVVILDYVHWPSAYANFPEAERRAMGITNADQLKAHVTKMLSDPSGFARERAQEMIANLPADRQAKVREQMNQMAAGLEAKTSEMRTKMSRIDYAVGNARIQGAFADVPIVSTLDGQTKTSDIKLQFIEGSWYLPTFEFAKAQSAG